MNSKTREVMFSSKDHNWRTPLELYNSLCFEFDFKLDACTSTDNPLGTPEFYTIEDDGLKKDWKTWTFVNPPFRNCDLWTDKAVQQLANYIGSVMLLPSRTGTAWFHRNIWNKGMYRPQYGREVRFLEKRLKFSDSGNSAPFDSMIVVFRPPGI